MVTLKEVLEIPSYSGMEDLVVEFIANFCDKHNIDFFVIRSKRPDVKYSVWHKEFVFDYVGDSYEKIGIVDFDTMIRWDAPNIFDLYDDEFVGVLDQTSISWMDHSQTAYKTTFPQFKDITVGLSEHINGGVLFFTKNHKPLFQLQRLEGRTERRIPLQWARQRRANDGGQRRGERVRQDVDDGPAGHVVDDDRQVDGVTDRLEVQVEAFLRRLVVVAGRVQHGVGAGLLGELRQLDRFLGRVRAGAGNDRHPLLRGLDRELDDAGRLVTIAAALTADECQIYTDVDGVYTTDPRIVPEARKLDRITFEEMLEMASLGSKVLQIRSVEFAGKYKVRLRVLSSLTDADLPLDTEAK